MPDIEASPILPRSEAAFAILRDSSTLSAEDRPGGLSHSAARLLLSCKKHPEVITDEARAAHLRSSLPVPDEPRALCHATGWLPRLRPPAVLLRTERPLGVLLEPPPVHFQLRQRRQLWIPRHARRL